MTRDLVLEAAHLLLSSLVLVASHRRACRTERKCVSPLETTKIRSLWGFFGETRSFLEKLSAGARLFPTLFPSSSFPTRLLEAPDVRVRGGERSKDT